MYNKKTVTVVLPAYNESKSISNFIEDLNNLNIFEAIIAVDNNSTDNTKSEILKNKAIYISEKKQGFGSCLKRGLDNVKTDLVLVCEPDGSFDATDSLIFLKESEKYDAVFSSRTKNMTSYLKYGNIIYAAVLSFLFKGPKLTDVGSSFRLFKRKDYDTFKHLLKYHGPEFQLELTIHLLRLKIKILEVSVNYKKRIGKSNYTGSFFNSLKVAIKFTKVVIRSFLKFE